MDMENLNWEELLKIWEQKLKEQREQKKEQKFLEKTQNELKEQQQLVDYYKNVVSPLKSIEALRNLGSLTKLQLLGRGFTVSQISLLEKKKILIKEYNKQTNLYYYTINGDFIEDIRCTERTR